MKKIILAFAFLVQTGFALATDHQAALATPRYENTKMYRQPGTSTQILKSLKSTDEMVVVRKFNAHWSIVILNGEVGYVLTSELTKPRLQPNNRTLAKN